MRNAIATIANIFANLRGRRSDDVNRKADSKVDSSRITILGVVEALSDRDLLHQISQRNEWQLTLVPTSGAARETLKTAKPQIIFVDRDIDGVDWRFGVSSLAAASCGACVLLISRVIDEYLWNEVVANGGYDVIRKPLNENDVLRNVKLAWSYWNGTRQPDAAAKK